MRKSLWIVLVLLIVVIGAPYAHADTFNVLGTATNETMGSLGSCAAGASCSFSGTLTIDMTTGAITAVDIQFPGLFVMDKLTISQPDGSDWLLGARAVVTQAMFLSFTTAPTPGSLVGFTGGTITGGNTIDALEDTTYNVTGGSITPTTAPEPSSLALVPLGLVALLLVRKRTSHPSAA